MNYLEAIQRAIEAMESVLPDSESAEQIIAKAGLYYNEHHFLHIFSEAVGLPLAAYIRFRKMSMAGDDVWLERERSLLDIALDYGYSTHESFSRAFRSFHGVLPNEVRKDGVRRHFNPQIIFLGGNNMKHINEAVTTTLSEEQRKSLKKAANAYIKKLEAVHAEFRAFAGELPERISAAGGQADEAAFISQKLLALTKNFDRDIISIRERYCECTEVAAGDSSWRYGVWRVDQMNTDELFALTLKANMLLTSSGLVPMERFDKYGLAVYSKAEKAADKYRRALAEVVSNIWNDINRRDEPETKEPDSVIELRKAVRDTSGFIRESYSIPEAFMLADSIDSDCADMSGKNIAVYFEAVKMFVNNEFAFAQKSEALERLYGMLNEITGASRGGFEGFVMVRAVHTSSLIRYAIFGLKKSLLASQYEGNAFDNLRSQIAKVEEKLKKDDRGYTALTFADTTIGDDGIPYAEGHSVSGELQNLQKELWALFQADTNNELFAQYHNFISYSVGDHINNEGDEW